MAGKIGCICVLCASINENGVEKVKTKKRLQLINWRLQNDIKQYELAALLECSGTYLSMVETGRIDPSRGFSEKVKDLTGLILA
jgi:predicted transcriptional regulator